MAEARRRRHPRNRAPRHPREHLRARRSLTRIALEIFTDREVDARAFLAPLMESPELRPVRIGKGEPLRQDVTESSLDDLVKEWPFLFRTRGRGGGDSLPPGPPPSLAQAYVSSGANGDAEDGARALESWAATMRPQLSILAVLTNEEVRRGLWANTVFVGGRLDLPPEKKTPVFSVSWRQHLERGIPDFYPMMVFGPRYVAQLGRDKIRTAPVASVREVAEDVFALRLVDDLTLIDVVDVARARDAVVNHLGRAAFFALTYPER